LASPAEKPSPQPSPGVPGEGAGSAYFLPYQVRWINDPARFKIVEKSRRTGFTYAQSYEDVRDAARAEKPLDVWFSSADESAAKEYIRYCEQWTKLFKIAAENLGEQVIDRDDDIKALVIAFASGKRIHALSSNPKAFRSKGGKLVLDEFAFHKSPEEMWKAAGPVITWGFPVRVLSTYNGKGNRYYRMVEDARKGNRWSLHTVTIEDAVAQGLVDKVLGRPATEAERQAFLLDCRETAGDEETYQQEYLCVPVDEATAWLTWDLITANEHPDAGRPELYQGGDCYVGMDIGRRRDLTVIWVIERVGDVLWTREVVRMKGASFAEQDAEQDRIFAAYRVRRCCMDQGGMGEKPVEDAQLRHGEYRVEGVIFSGVVKQHLATLGKQAFEDRKARIPAERAIRESHHAVRKTTTIAGNPRFDADRSEVGHADEFWAHMLALHAAEDTVQPPAGETVGTPEQIREAMQPQGLGKHPMRRMAGMIAAHIRGRQ
jgi:phage FluMu gp28-like protein